MTITATGAFTFTCTATITGAATITRSAPIGGSGSYSGSAGKKSLSADFFVVFLSGGATLAEVWQRP